MKIVSGLFFIILLIALLWFAIRSLIDLINEFKKRKIKKKLDKNEDIDARYFHNGEKE